MKERNEFLDALMSVVIQLLFLVVGAALVSIGTNAYFGIGLALLLIYHKSED